MGGSRGCGGWQEAGGGARGSEGRRVEGRIVPLLFRSCDSIVSTSWLALGVVIFVCVFVETCLVFFDLRFYELMDGGIT